MKGNYVYYLESCYDDIKVKLHTTFRYSWKTTTSMHADRSIRINNDL